jgi:hypothetical protein
VLARLPKEAAPPAVGKPEALWADLGGEDARRAYQAVRALAARPQEAVPLLRDRLRAVAASPAFDDDPARIARLIANLDSAEFDARDKASKELEKLGKWAEPALRKALQDSPNLEVRKRIIRLREAIARPTVSPERLQAERALEALERIGTGEARQALDAVSKEARNRWLRETVAGSLRRLGQEPASPAAGTGDGGGQKRGPE